MAGVMLKGNCMVSCEFHIYLLEEGRRNPSPPPLTSHFVRKATEATWKVYIHQKTLEKKEDEKAQRKKLAKTRALAN